MNERLLLFEDALAQARLLLARFPQVQTIASIISQIEYLIAVETGEQPDRTRLKDIIIGVQTAREIEPLDIAVAELFYRVSAEAKKMFPPMPAKA